MIFSRYLYNLHSEYSHDDETKNKTKRRKRPYSRFTTCLERVFRRTRIYYCTVHIFHIHSKYNNIIHRRKHLEGKTRRVRKTRPPHPLITPRAGRVSGHTRGRRRRVVIFNPKGHREYIIIVRALLHIHSAKALSRILGYPLNP